MGKFDMAGEIWSVVRPYIDPQLRQEVAKAVIEVVEELVDCPQLKKDSETDPNDVVDDWAPDYDEYDADYNLPFDRRD